MSPPEGLCLRCERPLTESDRKHLEVGWRKPEEGCFRCFSPSEFAAEWRKIALLLDDRAGWYLGQAEAIREDGPDSDLADVYEADALAASDLAVDIWRRLSAFHDREAATRAELFQAFEDEIEEQWRELPERDPDARHPKPPPLEGER